MIINEDLVAFVYSDVLGGRGQIMVMFSLINRLLLKTIIGLESRITRLKNGVSYKLVEP